MDKGLEALKEFRLLVANYEDKWSKNTTKHFIKCADTIEKELKALEIIKEKNVDVIYLHYECNCLEDYNEYNQTCELDKDEYLTQEEYNLLKEVVL